MNKSLMHSVLQIAVCPSIPLIDLIDQFSWREMTQTRSTRAVSNTEESVLGPPNVFIDGVDLWNYLCRTQFSGDDFWDTIDHLPNLANCEREIHIWNLHMPGHVFNMPEDWCLGWWERMTPEDRIAALGMAQELSQMASEGTEKCFFEAFSAALTEYSLSGSISVLMPPCC
jgi:hypothetical protein